MKPLPIAIGVIGLLALFTGLASAKPATGPAKPPTEPPTPPVKPPTPWPFPPSTPPVTPPVTPPTTAASAAAARMVANLFAAERSTSTVKAAKGREDKSLVSSFQSAAKLTADGLAGPGTLAAAAANGQYDLPHVFYWPTSANAQKVYEYRSALESIAEKLDASNPRAAAQLRASAAREHGEAGIVGPLAT